MSLAAWSAASAQTPTITTLTSFNSSMGDNPMAGLIADGNGNLYGTTVTGGLNADGTVFQIPYDKTTGLYASTPNTLVNFDASHGWQPKAGLIADGHGNLFGTTYVGGTNGYGTVFEIPYDATAKSYASTPTVLVNFDWSHGAYPQSDLVTDSKGNLFGTTYGGGSSNYGTVFEILYDTTTGTYSSDVITLVNFDGSNGRRPEAGLIADSSGNLFGTTFQGGSGGFGTAFELPYDAATALYDLPLVTLANFAGSNGQYPEGGLIADGNRNLFGTTVMGGSGVGTVFEIPYNATTSTYGAVVSLINFSGSNGSEPEAGLLMDSVGNLFGTTSAGGANGRGTVFEIPYSVSTASYASTPTVLINFDGNNNGSVPMSDLIADNSGNLYGTTNGGGYYSAGTAFQVTNSGFVPPLHFAGTPGQSNCVGVSSSTLAHTYGGISHAAASLGYPSVAALQSAVSSYCGH